MPEPQIDSFSRAIPALPVYNAQFELNTPNVVGIGRDFNVSIYFENNGDDLINLTLNLNTSGMISVPETILVGDLASGENYTHTWHLTSTAPGFALLKAEMQSDQTIFMTRQICTYIANISVGIHALDDTVNGGTFEFNVSATNNQESITYTDLMVNTSIRNLETNFIQPFISLMPGQTMNQSFSWDTVNEDPGTYQIEANLICNGIILASTEKSVNLKPDTTLNLYNGWNLISIPLMPEDTGITSLLSSINGNYSIVWAYNASDTIDHWKKYDPVAPFGNDLKSVLPREGYWIMMTSEDTLDISVTIPAPTDIELWNGWNLIGYNSLNAQPITNALSSINGNYSIVWAYNASDTADHWKKYDPFAPFGNDLDIMEPGKGYWIMMNANDDLRR